MCSVLLGVAAAGCASGPEELFRELAAPILEARCASSRCHGVGPNQDWPETDGLFFRVDGAQRLADMAQAREMAKSRILTDGPATLSTLVRVPMPAEHGGGPHWSGALFEGPDDRAARDLVAWIASEPDGTGGEDLALDPLEAQFGREVLPVLVERCARGGCHGPTDIAFTAFDVRPDPATGELAPRDIRAAYDEARPHLDLWGADPEGSRLIRKAVGAEAGGLVHRGGAGTFFPEAPAGDPLAAPGLQAMVEWARAEREAIGVAGDRTPAGLLYVQGPPASRVPFRIAAGSTGSDLMRAPWPPGRGAAENLTAALHPGTDAEVRGPALSHDARRVTVAMRLEGEAHFALWELDLEGGGGRRLTPPDANGSFVDPVYGPDGRVLAVWDGHGDPAADGEGVAPELVAVDPEGGGIERLTWTLAPEVSPAILSAGKTRGMVVFGTRRDGPSGAEGVLFRFPLCHDPAHHGEPEYHVQFGASIAPRAPLTARDLPDGRQVIIVLDSAHAADDRGGLALLDRSLGPALSAERADEASLGGYRDPFTWLDDAARWRDPAPLPDGRMVVARDDPTRPGEDALVVVSVRDGDEGAELGDVEPLVRVSGASLRSPVPIVARPLEDDGHAPVVDASAPRGSMAIRNAAVLEALYGRAEPHGARELRSDLAAVRLLVPASGAARGLGGGPPAAVLDEVDLADDLSAWIGLPARTPVLLQWLDARGLATGNQLDRWFYAGGDEVVPGGTNPATYDHVCSGCHGSRSGAPEDAAAPPPDAISAASITLSTHADRDPRQPLDPVSLPDEATPVDFRDAVGPVFAERCATAGCHGGEAPAAGLPLDGRAGTEGYPAAYETLLEGYVDAVHRSARRSVLVERLLGQEMDAPGEVSGTCPPGGADPALVRTVARWIETGAFYSMEPE